MTNAAGKLQQEVVAPFQARQVDANLLKVLPMLPAASAMYRRFPSCLTKAQVSPDSTTRAATGRGSAETRHTSSAFVIHRFGRPQRLLRVK